MATVVDQLLESALSLPPAERAELAEGLLASLEPLDPTIDGLWAKEAEDRLAAFRAGRMRAISADEVFAEFDLP